MHNRIISLFQVSYIINEYRYGRTPNPDVLCNTRIKFGPFLNPLIYSCSRISNNSSFSWLLVLVIGAFVDAISDMKFDFIASGHYAMVVHSDRSNNEESSALKLSKDTVSQL